MSDLFVLMELLTSSSSSDEDELMYLDVVQLKQRRAKMKNYIEEVVRKMSDKTVSFVG